MSESTHTVPVMSMPFDEWLRIGCEHGDILHVVRGQGESVFLLNRRTNVGYLAAMPLDEEIVPCSKP